LLERKIILSLIELMGWIRKQKVTSLRLYKIVVQIIDHVGNWTDFGKNVEYVVN